MLDSAPSRVPTTAKLLATMALWGGTFVAGRQLAGVVPPFAAAFWRFAIASVLLLALLRSSERRWPALTGLQALAMLLLALTGVFGYNAFFFTGLQHIPAGRAALIVTLNPVGIAVLSALVGAEPLRPVRVLGVLVAVAGAAIVITQGRISSIGTEVGPGELALLGCVGCWAAYSVLGKRAMKDLSPLASVAYAAAVGALLLAPFGIAQGALTRAASYGLAAWTSLLFLAVGGTVLGFLWYYQAIRDVGTVRAGVFISFVPVFGVLLGFLILREPLTPALLAGGPLVIAGAWIVNRSPRPPDNPRA